MSSSSIDDVRPSESKYLLDSSALLAVILDEPGNERIVKELERGALMSAVNLGEVAARLQENGFTSADVANTITELQVQIVPFLEAHALSAGELRASTKAYGLSLGDRCCIATAIVTDMPILTADKVWAQLDVGVTIELCR